MYGARYVVVVEESDGLFVGDEIYIEFWSMCIVMGSLGLKVGDRG